MSTRRILVAAIIALVTTSCSDAGPLNLSGSLSFNHTGGISGNFSAAGTVPFFGDFSSSAWAGGSRDSQNGGIVLTALMPQSSERYHIAAIVIPRLTVGSATIDANCSGNLCALVTVEFGASETDANYAQFCVLDAGSVAITSISDTRASGSFSGTGACTSQGGTVTSFTISNGSFDVPLLVDVPG